MRYNQYKVWFDNCVYELDPQSQEYFFIGKLRDGETLSEFLERVEV